MHQVCGRADFLTLSYKFYADSNERKDGSQSDRSRGMHPGCRRDADQARRKGGRLCRSEYNRLLFTFHEPCRRVWSLCASASRQQPSVMDQGCFHTVAHLSPALSEYDYTSTESLRLRVGHGMD